MQLTRSIAHSRLEEISRTVLRNCVLGVTIGNFDGMHKGHQALFERLDTELERIAAKHAKSPYRVLMTFQPHPRVVLSGLSRDEISARPEYWQLEPFRRRAELASEFGFHAFVALRFTRQFAEFSPEQFVKLCLVDGLHIGCVVVGHDWSFGKKGAGKAEDLKRFGEQYGFEAHVVNAVEINGSRVSSGAVKKALFDGDLREAESLLGRSFRLTGRVRHGMKRGRELGYPTANLEFIRQALPKKGVYATRIHIGEESFPSVTNVGVRPTFDANGFVVEVHLFGGNHYELYGKRVEVEFLQRLRDEKKFAGADELRAAIAMDEKAAWDYFQNV